MPPVVAKYLDRHATDEARVVRAGVAGIAPGYDRVCVVPLFDESARFIDGLTCAARAAGRCLVIAVVNARDDASPSAHERNRAVIDALTDAAEQVTEVATAPPISLLRRPVAGDVLDVLLIDRASPGWRFPARQGVGLARCIGCDVALALWSLGLVGSRWIHMTDGDVLLPEAYFLAADAVDPAKVALTYPFWHEGRDTPEAAVGTALGLYEVSLRYYLLGLRWAGSPYAFHAVGSTIAIDAEAYAAVRGVPKREAAEDFYLLNKLAKVGQVTQPRVAPLRIRGRLSTRVPFGTGAATRRITGELAHGQVFAMYDPRCFVLLRRWLELANQYARDADGAALDRALDGFFGDPALDRREARALVATLAALGARDALIDARSRVRSAGGLADRVRVWFDSFRTLKLIHGVRDAGLVNRPWRDALRDAPFVRDIDASADLDAIRRHLFALESRAGGDSG